MSITLTKIAETNNTITLGWTPVPGCIGYVFYADDKRVSNTWDPNKSSVKFAKGAAEYRVDAVGVEDTGSYPPSTPEPPPWGAPITITQGGVYEGSWESTTTAPAVKISTTQPVTLRGRARNLGDCSVIIDALGSGVQLTMENLTVTGSENYSGSGRAMWAENFKAITVRNVTIVNTCGIELALGVTGSTVSILRTRHTNIKGYAPGGDIIVLGNFVQLRSVQNAVVEIAWNEVLNEYNKSFPEDIISCLNSRSFKLHDNYLEHQSSIGNTPGTSQNPITLEGCSGYEVTDNQVVDACGGIFSPGSSNGLVARNRVVQDGFLPDGTTRIANGYTGISVPSGTNQRVNDNVVGYVNRDGNRSDYSIGAGVVASGNSQLGSPITRQTELNERTLWQQKLAANGVTIGAP